jgi:hypothetical protein
VTIRELKQAIALAQTLDRLSDETQVVVEKWPGDVIVESVEDPNGSDEWVLVIRG